VQSHVWAALANPPLFSTTKKIRAFCAGNERSAGAHILSILRLHNFYIASAADSSILSIDTRRTGIRC
jgi:hypothetical protein